MRRTCHYQSAAHLTNVNVSNYYLAYFNLNSPERLFVLQQGYNTEDKIIAAQG